MKDFTLKQCKYTILHKDINPYTFDDFYEYYIKDNVRLTFTYNERLKYMFKIHSGLEINIILGRTEKLQIYICDFIRIIKRLLLNSSLLKIYLKLLTTNIIYGIFK